MGAKEFLLNTPDEEGPHPALFKRGMKVRLPEVEGDDVPQEEGTIIGYGWSGTHDDGCYMYQVELFTQFILEEGDDGLREVGEEQIEVLEHNG